MPHRRSLYKKLGLGLCILALALVVICYLTAKSAKSDISAAVVQETVPAEPVSPLASEIYATAKFPLLNCGVALNPQDSLTAIECAKVATEQQRPFLVQIRIEGIDSIVWVAALQLPSGRRLFLQHDDFGQGRTTRQDCLTFSFTYTFIPIGCER